MKKRVFGRKFKRDKNERKALFKSLLSSLVLKERIKITEQKAKSIKGQAEKLITQVRKNGVEAAGFMHQYLTHEAIDKLVNQIAPRFSKRNGGYTRIVRVGKRFNDNASLVLLEWTEQPSLESRIQNSESRKEKKSSKVVQKKEQKKIVTTEIKKKPETPKKPRTQKKSSSKTK